jgi:DNA-directed RNA polymerase subunit omega
MKLKDGFDSNYRYVLVAARRARQISGGAPPLVATTARKPCKIAQEEIDAGKIQYLVKAKAEEPAKAGEPAKTEEPKAQESK